MRRRHSRFVTKRGPEHRPEGASNRYDCYSAPGQLQYRTSAQCSTGMQQSDRRRGAAALTQWFNTFCNNVQTTIANSTFGQVTIQLNDAGWRSYRTG